MNANARHRGSMRLLVSIVAPIVLALGCTGACTGGSEPVPPADPPAISVEAAGPSEQVSRPVRKPKIDAPDPSAQRLSYSRLNADNGSLKELLVREALAANKAGKRVYLETWASWCPPCRKVDALLKDDALAVQLGRVHLILVNVDAFDAELNPLGFDSPTIPAFYELTKRGRPTGRMVNGHKWSKAASIRQQLPAFLLAAR